MRTFLLTAVILSVAFAGCVSSNDGDLEPEPEAPAIEQEPWFENWSTLEAHLVIDVDPTVDPQPAPRAAASTSQFNDGPVIKGNGTYTIHNARDVPESRVLFFGGFTLTKVTDEQGNALRVDGGEVDLNGDVSAGTTRTLYVEFEGRNGDALVPVAGGDEFSAHYFTLAPYTSGSTNAVAHVYATVTSPSDWTVLAAADRLGESESEGVLTRDYLGYYPYLVGFSGNGMESQTDDVDGVEVRTWYFPSQETQGLAMHENTVRAMGLLPQWIGDYPFDHIWTVPHHVNVNAFSVPGINFMGWTFYRPAAGDAPVQFGRDLIPIFGSGDNAFENVLVHETTHNWWGSMVRYNNSNTDGDGWKDNWVTEGITTYTAETVYWGAVYGEEAAADSAEHMVRSLLEGRADEEATCNRDGDCSDDGGDCGVSEACGDYYVKGAMAMRALEAYGIATGRPELTFDAMKHALSVHARQYGGSGVVNTDEIIDSFEEAIGENLTWWEEGWFYSRHLSDFTIHAVEITTDGVLVRVENLGQVRGAALVEVEFVSGESVRQWTVLNGTEAADVIIPLTDTDLVPQQATVDPLQYVYEMNEDNNVWAVEDAPA